MSALTELRDGQLADAFVALVARTVRSVAIARNFPPPEGHERWDSKAVSETTADFFASLQTPLRLTDLRLRCTTEDDLRRLLQTMIRNYLADIAVQRPYIRQVSLTIDVTAFDPPQEVGTSRDKMAKMAGTTLVAVRAGEIFGLLNDLERAALSFTPLSEPLFVSKPTMEIIKSRAIAIIRAELGEEEKDQEIAEAVIKRTREWSNLWRSEPDATY